MTTERVEEITKPILREWLRKPVGDRDDYLRANSPSGFGVRRYKGTGRAVFFAESRLGVRGKNHKLRKIGKPRRVGLGEASTGALDRAIEEAQDALAQLRQGRDINAQKATQAIVSGISGMSLDDALERYIELKSKKTHRPMAENTVEDMRRVFKLHLTARLKGRPVLELQTKELQDALEAIKTRSNQTKARRYLSAVIESAYAALNTDRPNPMKRVKDVGEPLAGRTTYLPAGSAQSVWQWLQTEEAYEQPPRIRSALLLIQFVMLTGARRDEAVDLEWSAVDTWEQNLIRLHRTKNGTTHFVPITPPIGLILNEAGPEGSNGPVFAGTSAKRKVTTQAITEALELIYSKAEPILMDADHNRIDRTFTLHDLRRTIATALVSNLGTPAERVSRVLNHRQVDGKGAAATELYIQINPAIIEPELTKYHSWLCQLPEVEQMVEDVWRESTKPKPDRNTKVVQLRRHAG